MKTPKTPAVRSAPAKALEDRKFRHRVVPDRRRRAQDRQWKQVLHSRELYR